MNLISFSSEEQGERTGRIGVQRIQTFILILSAFFSLGATHQAEAKEGVRPDQLAPQCLYFSTPQAWATHRKGWERQLMEEVTANEAESFAWWMGKVSPPKSITSETRLQARCMMKALIRDLSKVGGDPREIAMLLELDEKLMTRRKAGLLTNKGLNTIFRSHYRSFKTQFYLWKKRGEFGKAISAKERQKAADSCKGQHQNNEGLQWCINKEVFDGRQENVMRGTAPPAISRHHWGTEVDLFAVNRHKFRDRGALGPVYKWLQSNAHHFGFFQPYTRGNRSGYMEERWHWSYGPISVPILAHLRVENGKFEAHLERTWRAAGGACAPKVPETSPCFSKVRDVWRTRVYDVDESHLWLKSSPTVIKPTP